MWTRDGMGELSVNAWDWFVMGVAAPLLIAGVWVVVVKVWSAGLRVDDAVGWFAGEGEGLRGYHAFLGPAAVAMTTGWLGALLTEGFGVDSYGEGPGALAVNVLFVACVLFMALGFWMWAVKWPKFLIPPQFRDRGEPAE